MPEPPKRSNSKLGPVDKRKNRQPIFMKTTIARRAKEQQVSKCSQEQDNLIRQIHQLVQGSHFSGTDSVAAAKETLSQLEHFIIETQKLIPPAQSVTCLAELADPLSTMVKQLQLDLQEKESGCEQQKRMSEFYQRKLQDAENNLQMQIIEFEEKIKNLTKNNQDLQAKLRNSECQLKEVNKRFEEVKIMWEQHRQLERVKTWVISSPKDFLGSEESKLVDSKLKRPISAFSGRKNKEQTLCPNKPCRVDSAISTISCANSGTTHVPSIRRKNSGQTDISFANCSET